MAEQGVAEKAPEVTASGLPGVEVPSAEVADIKNVSLATDNEVTIKSPVDSVLNPAKLSRNDSGSAIPTSCESLFGSSPDLPHKDPGLSKLSCYQNSLNDSEQVGEVFSQSQWGSSICPQLSSGHQQDSSLEENLEY